MNGLNSEEIDQQWIEGSLDGDDDATGGFILILVIFILLVIIGARFRVGG